MCLSVHTGESDDDDDDDDDGVQVFRGNLTAANHFNELFVEQSSLLLGARSANHSSALCFHVLARTGSEESFTGQ